MSTYRSRVEAPDTITPRQLKCIHSLARAAGLDSDALHSMAYGVARVESLKELSKIEAGCVINRLKGMVGQELDVGRPGMATDAQTGLLHRLQEELGWTDERMRRFCEIRFGVSHPRFLSPRVASQVIQALKAMLAGGRAERSGYHDRPDGAS